VRIQRALLATLVLATLLTVSALARPEQAVAAEPVALVSVTLHTFSPALPTRDGQITVTGTVTNLTQKRIFRPRAYFWRNQAPITDAEGFAQAGVSASNEPLGARYIADGSYDNLFDPDVPYLERGATRDFTLKVQVADLALSPTSGVYLMGVHVLQNESVPAVGRVRVFVPVLSRAPRNTQQMTSVVALASRPSLLRPGVFSDDHLAAELAPGGRLSVLLRAADARDVSFAVDPELVSEITTMKEGYQVLGDDASTSDGAGRADATRWLDRFTELLADHDGYRLLYGSPDVAGLAHAGRQDLLHASEAAAKTVSLTASLPLLVWPGDGAADAETVAAATALQPNAILLSDVATGSTRPLLQGVAVDGTRSPEIVSYTSAAFAGGPGPQPSETPVHLRQRLLAESWLQAATRPAGTTLGHVRLISTKAQAKGNVESVVAPWIRQSTLSELLKSAPATWSGQLRYGESDRSAEITVGQLATLDRLSRSWETWQDLLVDHTSAKAATSAALARSTSVRLRPEDRFRAFLEPQQAHLDLLLSSVQISANRRVLTPPGRVEFPVTIRNTLPPSTDPANVTLNQVQVELRFRSANSQRLTVQPLKLTAIDAGENHQGTALVDARTNGTVRVNAQLYTASGLPVGRAVAIDVKATQAGSVGWLIAVGAGIVLVGSTALRIRQVTRDRARQAAAAEGAGGDATRSGPAVQSRPDEPESIDV